MMKQGTLYFLPYKGDNIVVAQKISSSETGKYMVDYLRNNGYAEPGYWRMWGDGTWYKYDFGSHVEFFKWEEDKNGNA